MRIYHLLCLNLLFVVNAFSHATAQGIVIDIGDLDAAPTSGPEWQNVLDWSDKTSGADIDGTIDLSFQDDNDDQVMLAKAIRGARTRNRAELIEARDMILSGLGSYDDEFSGGILALSRNAGVVVVAWYDLIKATPVTPAAITLSQQQQFEDWMEDVYAYVSPNERSIKINHERRPNNHGSNAGFACLAIALAQENATAYAHHLAVFRGYLGDRNSWSEDSSGVASHAS